MLLGGHWRGYDMNRKHGACTIQDRNIFRVTQLGGPRGHHSISFPPSLLPSMFTCLLSHSWPIAIIVTMLKGKLHLQCCMILLCQIGCPPPTEADLQQVLKVKVGEWRVLAYVSVNMDHSSKNINRSSKPVTMNSNMKSFHLHLIVINNANVPLFILLIHYPWH